MSFEMFAGDTKRLRFSLFNADGQPLDITGATVRWRCSRWKGDKFSSTPSIAKSSLDDIDVTDPFAGLLTVNLKPEDTENLSGIFYAELELEDVDGDIATAYSDTFTINRALIKPTVP
jgi:hypothetical protein